MEKLHLTSNSAPLIEGGFKHVTPEQANPDVRPLLHESMKDIVEINRLKSELKEANEVAAHTHLMLREVAKRATAAENEIEVLSRKYASAYQRAESERTARQTLILETHKQLAKASCSKRELLEQVVRDCAKIVREQGTKHRPLNKAADAILTRYGLKL